MKVFEPHIQSLTLALQTPSPLVMLPPLHPEYLRSLFVGWIKAKESDSRKVDLHEPGCGRSKLDHSRDLLTQPSGERDLAQRLRKLMDDTGLDTVGGHVHWLSGTEALLSDPVGVAQLVALCRRMMAHNVEWRLAIDTPAMPVPTALTPWLVHCELQTPRGGQEFAEFVEAVLKTHLDLGDLPGQARDEIIRLLRGLDAGSVNLVLDAAFTSDDTPEPPDLVRRIRKECKRHLSTTSGLKVIEADFDEADLQGMECLKRHLDYTRVAFGQHEGFNSTTHAAFRPKGVLLAGLPGCGKSLAARLTASRLALPLLKLEVGALMGQYLGESESNLNRALDAAEASAPCVLWVDEMEKALGGMTPGGNDGGGNRAGGTESRMLGRLLDWMQTNEEQVYLFATANDVNTLPPELLRRGRFDELWKVLLPTKSERKAILSAKLRRLTNHLSKDLKSAIDEVGETTSNKDFDKLVDTKTDRFSGADLESLVQSAWFRHAVFDEVPISARLLLDIIDEGFVPMSKQFETKIEQMEARFLKHGFRDVSSDDMPPAVPRHRLNSVQMLPARLRDLWAPEGRMLLFQVDGKNAELAINRATPMGTRGCVRRGSGSVLEGKAMRVGSTIHIQFSDDETWTLAAAEGDMEVHTSADVQVLFIDDFPCPDDPGKLKRVSQKVVRRGKDKQSNTTITFKYKRTEQVIQLKGHLAELRVGKSRYHYDLVVERITGSVMQHTLRRGERSHSGDTPEEIVLQITEGAHHADVTLKYGYKDDWTGVGQLA